MAQNPDRVRRILGKLEEARSKGLECFGSKSHGFRLNPPIAEEVLRTFEREQGVRLPDDYCTFLLHAGDGGAGPYYGIFPLERWDDFADWVIDDRPADLLARPCPLRPGRNAKVDRADAEAGVYQGTLSLGSQGCSYAMQLIVSGPYAGRVAYVDADGQPPYVVREPDFLSWYERWLNELLGGYRMNWFGYGPSGGEEDFLRILNDPSAEDDLKVEAAAAFCRLPALSDHASAEVRALLRHPLAGVRSRACSAVETFRLRQAADEAARLLHDPSAEVRRQAVRAVMEVDTGRGAGAVLRRLHEESDGAVTAAAFFKLKQAGALPKAELLRILERSDSGNLRGLAAQAAEWSIEDVPRLIRLLSDPHVQVRVQATLGLRRLGAKGSLPHLLDLLDREGEDAVVQAVLRTLGGLGDASVVPALLEWTRADDDFHRLDSVRSLVKIGDERVVPAARAMLREHRRPVRRDANGLLQRTSVHTIAQLVQKSLTDSPNRALRALVR